MSKSLKKNLKKSHHNFPEIKVTSSNRGENIHITKITQENKRTTPKKQTKKPEILAANRSFLYQRQSLPKQKHCNTCTIKDFKYNKSTDL